MKELDEIRWAARQSSGHGQQGLSDLLEEEEEEWEGEAGGEGLEAQAGGQASPGGDVGDGQSEGTGPGIDQSEGTGPGIDPPPDPMDKLFVWFGKVSLFTRPLNSKPYQMQMLL